MRLELSQKRVGITLDDAKDLIADYCFQEVSTPPHPPDQRYGPRCTRGRDLDGVTADLLAIAPVVNETVARIPSHVRFWTLRDEEIAHPAEGSSSWLLHRAWYLVESVPHCGLTNTHKILHHACRIGMSSPSWRPGSRLSRRHAEGFRSPVSASTTSSSGEI